MRTLIIVHLLFVVLSISSCGSKTSTTTVRGRVTFENKPIAGAEVRFSGPQGEDSRTTSIDGNFDLSIKSDRNDTLELKVLWPGYAHDEIKFKPYEAKDQPIDIHLKKIFTPGTPANK